MKISNSKKQLAKIISENGGWNARANWYVQHHTKRVAASETRPEYIDGMWGDTSFFAGFFAEKITNWHQTILSRDEYFHLYPAQDAVAEVVVENKTTCHLTVTDKPTIEQLAAECRNLQDYAERKQQEADAAKAEAEAKLSELVAAGKAVGLAVSVAAPEPELVITDWRDLQVGDVIRCVSTPYGARCVVGMRGVITEVEASGVRARFRAALSGRADGSWFSASGAAFEFIRRPAKGATDA